MGTELSKQTAEGEDEWAASDLAASVPPGIAQQQQCEATGPTTITTAAAVAQWHAWLRETESLYVKGRIKDCREALQRDTPTPPADSMAAALLSAVARANAAICQHAGVSMHFGDGGADC
ncbi:unnamed protein product, partial [Laminaria digitata]